MSPPDRPSPEETGTGRPGGEPTVKRRRIAVACRACRQRKSRCDGSTPSCGFCSDAGTPCTYEQPIRAPQTRDVLGDRDHRLKNIEDLLQRLVRQGDEHSGPRSPQSETIDVPTFDRNYREFPASYGENTQNCGRSEDEIDGLAAVHGHTAGTRFFGSSSNIAFLSKVSQATSAVLKDLAFTQRIGQDDAKETLTRLPSPVPSLSTPNTQSSNPLIMPTEPHAIHLFNLYFSNTGTMFPYVSEKRVLSSYYEWKMRRFSGAKRSHLCLFNSIFAFATLMSSEQNQPVSKRAAQSDMFYNRALALSTIGSLQSSDIETVQYLLLLAKYCQNTQKPEETWSLHGQAVQAATRLGLHSASMLNKSKGTDHEIMKRLWFGCFILDRTLSMTLGRPPIIQDSQMNLDLPLDVALDQISADHAGHEELEGRANTTSFFIVTIQLYKILSSILTKLYQQNRDEHVETSSEMIKEVVTIEDELRNWKENLPHSLRRTPWMEDGVHDSSHSPPRHHLTFARLSAVVQIRYLNVRILLHRPTLQLLLGRKPSQGADENAGSQTMAEMVWKSSVAICQDCAAEIIDIVYRLSKTMDLLGARWFSIYYTFNAALVIFSCFLLGMDGGDSPSYPISKIRLAIEATKRLDDDTKGAQRVLAVLEKLISISIILMQRVEARRLGGERVAVHGHQSNRTLPLEISSTPSGLSNAPQREDGTGTETELYTQVLTPLDPHDAFPVINSACQTLESESIDIFGGLEGLYPDLLGVIDF